jgi:hypothetical protein
MNIFITDVDPSECAAALADQHVRSQIGETARILTTALHRHGITDRLLGKPYNPNGRFAKWAAEDWNHFMWLAMHGMALVDEYNHRFDRVHANAKDIYIAGNLGYLMLGEQPHLPAKWPRCKATEDLIDRDVFCAYQQVLREKYAAWKKKGRGARWTGTHPPAWLTASFFADHCP